MRFRLVWAGPDGGWYGMPWVVGRSGALGSGVWVLKPKPDNIPAHTKPYLRIIICINFNCQRRENEPKAAERRAQSKGQTTCGRRWLRKQFNNKKIQVTKWIMLLFLLHKHTHTHTYEYLEKTILKRFFIYWHKRDLWYFREYKSRPVIV